MFDYFSPYWLLLSLCWFIYLIDPPPLGSSIWLFFRFIDVIPIDSYVWLLSLYLFLCFGCFSLLVLLFALDWNWLVWDPLRPEILGWLRSMKTWDPISSSICFFLYFLLTPNILFCLLYLNIFYLTLAS